MSTLDRAQQIHHKHPDYNSRTCLGIARMVEAPTLDFEEMTHGRWEKRAYLTRNGFDVVVRIIPDDYPDTSFLGTFTDDPDNAIPTGGGSRDWQFFRPEGMDDLYEWLRTKGGMTVEQATDKRSEAAQLALRQATDPYVYQVVVTVYRQGVELALDALSGVYFDQEHDPWGDHYGTELANDMIPTAIEEAKAVLARLCNEGTCS